MLSSAAAVRNYLVVTIFVATICLAIGFTVSKAQTDSSETTSFDEIRESEHAALPEQPAPATYHEGETGTLQEEPAETLLERNASTSISGRISTENGVGISHGQMILVAADGRSKIAVSDSFGYFQFAEIRTGLQVTIKSVDGSRYHCAPITMQLTGISNANFTCTQPINEKAAKANPLPPPNCVEDAITDRSRQPLDSEQQALVPIAEPPDCRSLGSR